MFALRASRNGSLLRLRNAIAEMDDVPGEQMHRSWWVARGAVAEVSGAGRNREIRLPSGTSVPVARDSVERLQRSGFLPA
jgi:DNA-binding LytR/AlgR family response regulator